MLPQRRGLIVNTSSGGGVRYTFNVPFGVQKSGVDRMARDMAHELKPYGFAAVSIWPGYIKSEKLAAQPDRVPAALAKLIAERGETPDLRRPRDRGTGRRPRRHGKNRTDRARIGTGDRIRVHRYGRKDPASAEPRSCAAFSFQAGRRHAFMNAPQPHLGCTDAGSPSSEDSLRFSRIDDFSRPNTHVGYPHRSQSVAACKRRNRWSSDRM